MDNGFIVLHRKFLKWEWYQEPNMVSIFIHLLLLANHEEGRWKGNIIKRGQLITGRLKLAKELKMSQRSVRTCLTRLKTTNEIAIKTTSKFSIITIIKYDYYQKIRERTTSKSTNKLTNNQPTTNQQLTTNNNNKQLNNVNNTTTIVVEGNPNNDFGNPDINWLLKEFEKTMGFKSMGGNKDRIYAKHLLNNLTREQLTYMLDYISKNEYAPRVGSLEKLWFKRGDIIAGIKTTTNKNNMLKL